MNNSLKRILRLHSRFLKGDKNGLRANLIKADLSGAYLIGADLSEANLSAANLSGADLRGANLSRAYFKGTIYEKDIPLIINTEYYNVVKCKQYIRIGCKVNTPEQWAEFTLKEIASMDENALVFWKKYKKLILMTI